MDVFRPPRHSSVSQGRLPIAFEPNHEHRYSPSDSDRKQGEGKEGVRGKECVVMSGV